MKYLRWPVGRNRFTATDLKDYDVILDKYFLRVYRMAMRNFFVEDLAEPVTQDIFKHVLNNLDKVRQAQDEDKYMFDLAFKMMKAKQLEEIEKRIKALESGT